MNGGGAEHFGHRLRALRIEAGLSVHGLARRSGYSAGAISKAENGIGLPRWATAEALLLACGVTDLGPWRIRWIEAKQGTGSQRIAELPAPPADFQGRREALRRILAAARRVRSSGQPRVVVISGAPGSGKTSLAVKAGVLASAAGLSGIELFVELHAAGTPVDPASAQLRLLRTLGDPEPAIPSGAAERTARLRRLLAERRGVLVLDDAGGEEQVRPLLPGAASALLVLITSRDRLSGLSDVEHVTLADLDEAEALAMLARIAGADRVAAEPQAAAGIVRVCGRWPLAVRIAGNLLAQRPQWTLRHLASELGGSRDRLSRLRAGDLEIRAPFEAAYRRLPEAARQLLSRLALVPGPDFTAETARVVGGVPAETALAALTRMSLVEPAPGDGRFRMHDLVRDLAREQPDDGAPQAESRLFTWLLGTAVQAARACSPAPIAGEFPGGRTAALSWLDSEAAAWQGALGIIAQRPAGPLDDAVTGLIDPIGWYYDLRCRWTDMARVAKLTGEIARRRGDLGELASALNLLGLSLIEQQRFDEAVEWLESALRAARDCADRRQEADVHAKLGLAHGGRGDHERALAHHLKCSRISLDNGFRLGHAHALGHVGHELRVLGRLGEARSRTNEALALRTELGDERAAAMARYRLAAIDNDEGGYEAALFHLALAWEVFGRFGDEWGLAAVLTEQGRAHLGLGKTAEAAEAAARACELFERLGHGPEFRVAQRVLAEAGPPRQG